VLFAIARPIVAVVVVGSMIMTVLMPAAFALGLYALVCAVGNLLEGRPRRRANR